MPEPEPQMESAPESPQTKTKEELHAVDNVIKKEPSIIDEILSLGSADSKPRLDGDTNSGGEQQKEVMGLNRDGSRNEA